MRDEQDGENVATILMDFVHDDKRGEALDFIAEIARASSADKRKLCRLIVKIADELSRADKLTHQNSDVVNFCTHLKMCCGSLPLQD